MSLNISLPPASGVNAVSLCQPAQALPENYISSPMCALSPAAAPQIYPKQKPQPWPCCHSHPWLPQQIFLKQSCKFPSLPRANLQEEESSGLGSLQIPPVFHAGSCSHLVKPLPPSPAVLLASRSCWGFAPREALPAPPPAFTTSGRS